MLASTGRRKEVLAVDAGVVVGMVASFVAVATGVGLVGARREGVGWVAWGGVAVGVAGVVVGEGVVGLMVSGRGVGLVGA